MRQWRWAEPAVVRATIAAGWAPAAHPDCRLGEITLHEHQRDAAARLRSAIERFGGALLADDVGLGKTYTALGAAHELSPVLVVAPAALLEMWRGALDATRVVADLVSFESLSRSAPRRSGYALVIVDEAHHARNRLTRRYARLADLTRSSKVLLLSATPLHNAASDLRALLALFLGSRAERLTPEQQAACIVRRGHHDVTTARLPHRSAPTWLEIDGSPALLKALVDVPAPCPPRDAGDGGALVTLSLVRAWASTEAALRATLRRRLARANALSDSLASGRYPTRAELRAWVVGDDATQLAFPELMVDAALAEWPTLVEAVGRHTAGLRRALGVLADCEGRSDDARCALIREVRRRHPADRIVVFSTFADSVRAIFERLRTDGGVAAVTANGAWVAGGPITRADALARFTATHDRPGSARAHAIEVLIATDLLSEGLNLQSASVVVHLDLPWTAARLAQRMGRVWRMSSPHARVHEYALAPPAPAERLLRVLEVLRRKAGAASKAFGEAVAPLLVRRDGRSSESTANPVTAVESLRRRLRHWNEAVGSQEVVSTSMRIDERVAVTAVRAAEDGWLALVVEDAGPRLVCRVGSAPPTTSPERLCDGASAAEGEACVASPSRVERVLGELDAFRIGQQAAADAGIVTVGSRTHAAAAVRIASAAARAPAHRRTVVSRLAVSARRAVEHSRSAGRERLLRALLATDGPAAASETDEAWLGRVIELDTGTPNAGADAATHRSRVVAVVLLLPDPRPGGSTASTRGEMGD